MKIRNFTTLRICMDGRGVNELQARLVELNQDAQAIQLRADELDRDLTDEERREIDALLEEFDVTEAQLKRRLRIEDQQTRAAQPQPRMAQPEREPGDGAEIDVPAGRAPRIESLEDRRHPGRWGWQSFGQFAGAVVSASKRGGSVDQRLSIRMAPTTYGSEAVGEDGGFAVPPDFRTAIYEKVFGEDSLIGRTDQLLSSSNSITVPKDETTPWGSTGVQAYWEGEAAQITQSKPALETNTIRLNKLTALVGVTEELLEDAPALDSYVRRKAPERFDFKVNRAIIAGNGAGQPLGLLNAGCKVAVAKEGSQAADTILFENIVKMYSRMYAPSMSSAVWLANQDIMPQLLQLNFISTDVTGATAFGGTPVYLPPGGLSATPFGSLMGRPIVFSEACETLGDEGDLIFADLTQYMTARKVQGIRQDTSIHLWFDYDVMAFRFIMRVAGQPWWNTTITPRSGSGNTLSTVVTLAARA